MAYRIEAEGSGRFPILRLTALTPDTERAGRYGPFKDRDLFEQLVALEAARCYASGCPREMIGGATRSSWHLNVTVPARDLALLVPALKAWLEDLNVQPLRSYVASPPPLNAQPGRGESWARPTVESVVAAMDAAAPPS